MSKRIILIFPFDLMSHYLRCIELASNYKNYDILFARSREYNDYVIKAGFGLFDVEGFDPEMVMVCSRKFNFSWLNKKDIERVFLSQLKVMDHYQPEFVIGDTSPTLKMASEKQGVKYIALMNGYMTKYYAETRALSRTHPGYKHLKKLPIKVANKIIVIAETISFRIVHKPFKQLRRQYMLKRVSDYLNEMEGDENLICDDPKLFPQKKLPFHYKITGPLLYTIKTGEKELINSLNINKPTVCICMGSSGDIDVLHFLSKPQYSHFNIIIAGDSKNRIKGDHIITKPFLNLDKILPLCSYLICHGGNGTIYKGLQHKVFILCLTSHFEQEWNVEMLERLKLGISINDDPERMMEQYLSNLK